MLLLVFIGEPKSFLHQCCTIFVNTMSNIVIVTYYHRTLLLEICTEKETVDNLQISVNSNLLYYSIQVIECGLQLYDVTIFILSNRHPLHVQLV